MPTPAINALLMAGILSRSSRLRLGPAQQREEAGRCSSSRAPLAILLVLQRAPQDLAGRGLRQLFDELDRARHLERRHAAARPVDDLPRVRPSPRPLPPPPSP